MHCVCAPGSAARLLAALALGVGCSQGPSFEELIAPQRAAAEAKVAQIRGLADRLESGQTPAAGEGDIESLVLDAGDPGRNALIVQLEDLAPPEAAREKPLDLGLGFEWGLASALVERGAYSPDSEPPKGAEAVGVAVDRIERLLKLDYALVVRTLGYRAALLTQPYIPGPGPRPPAVQSFVPGAIATQVTLFDLRDDRILADFEVKAQNDDEVVFDTSWRERAFQTDLSNNLLRRLGAELRRRARRVVWSYAEPQTQPSAGK